MLLGSALTSLLFVSQVTAVVSTAPLFSQDAPVHALLARQGRTPLVPPAQCETACDSGTLNQLNICISTTCLCSEDNAQGLETCVECIVGTSPSAANIAAGQAVLDKFADTCKGSSLPTLTVTATAPPGAVTGDALVLPTIPTVITVSPPPGGAAPTGTGTSTGTKETGTEAAPSTPSSPRPSPNNTTKDNAATGIGAGSGPFAMVAFVGGVLAVVGL